MRLSVPATIRNDYLEQIAGPPQLVSSRNPARKFITYEAVQGPHAETSRAVYATPANKVALLESVQIVVRRVTAPTVVGVAWGTLHVRPLAGASQISMAQVPLFDGVVGTFDMLNEGYRLALVPTDQLIFKTYDDSTGGQVEYRLNAHLIEFDQL